MLKSLFNVCFDVGLQNVVLVIALDCLLHLFRETSTFVGILSFQSNIFREFGYYLFSREQIDVQPNEVYCGFFYIKVY